MMGMGAITLTFYLKKEIIQIIFVSPACSGNLVDNRFFGAVKGNLYYSKRYGKVEYLIDFFSCWVPILSLERENIEYCRLLK